MPLSKEQAEAAAKAIMDTEHRKLAERQSRIERQQARGAGKRQIGICALVGYFLASALAGALGGDPRLWSVAGFVIGGVCGWRLGRSRKAPGSTGP